MNYQLVFNNPIDSTTTFEAKMFQETEMFTLLNNTIQSNILPNTISNIDFLQNRVIFKTSDNQVISCKINNQDINFLTLNDVIKINQDAQKLFEEEGIYGLYGLKDKSIVETALNNISKNSVVFGKDQFPTIANKAAHLWFKLARYQAFNNGNKRTGLLVALNFLENNNYHVKYTEGGLDRDFFYDISKEIANGKWSEKDIRNCILNICELKIKEER